MAEKNMIIALILSFFINGLGHVYDGLIKRGIVCFAVGVIISILNLYVSSVFTYISLLWWIYVLYDTYQCTNAINNNQALPLFLTQFDIE